MLLNALSECCGCHKCYFVCPTHAITMEQDKTGFLYPQIDKEKCVFCNNCSNSCMFKERIDNAKSILPQLQVYAAKNKNEIDRLNSRSGGVFTALSNNFILNRDIVYGCLLTANLEAVHSRATDINIRNKFRGSKYVQSDISTSFVSVQEDLNNGHRVLFSGTPCQVDALQSYVHNKENLYTIDIVCYGVSSPKIWSDYIEHIQQKHHGRIELVNFRDKIEFGWKAHKESFVINGQKICSKEYARLFQKKFSLRPSCFQCPYKSLSRVSDITLGDFWGIDKVLPEFNDNKGVSLVIVNSYKGQEIFEKIQNDIICIETPIEACIQPSLVEPEKMPENYTTFWNDYIRNGLPYVLNKYNND